MKPYSALVLSCAVLAAATFGSVREAHAADAKLYEVTENMKLKTLTKPRSDSESLRRQASSALTGTARAGTPLCPLPAGSPPCVVNVVGSDDIDVATGLGTFKGKWTTVVHGDNDVDAPEYEIASGKFDGVMDFSPALVYGLPYGTVSGELRLDRQRVPFTGVFSLPFVWPGDPSRTPLYLGADGPTPIQPNEYSIGYPAVKFEITF
jgi:hypothetical protein